MNISKILKLSAIASLTMASLSANAAANTFNTIYGSNFGTSGVYSTTFLGDVGASFTAVATDGSLGNFTTKSQAGYEGAGVLGNGSISKEIDIGESINGYFSTGITISNFTLGLLFDGPEYGDVNEKALISVEYADGSTGSFTFTSTGINTATWTGSGSFVNLSSSSLDSGAVWSISNPFGDKLVSYIGFSAVKGVCGSAGGTCDNQTDYTLISVSAVPEPETYAMMLAGLGLMGFTARRRK